MTSDKKYTLRPSRELKLWRFDHTLRALNFYSYHEDIIRGPALNGWAHCKSPMPSQILGFWLRSIGGDGILFRSTQMPRARCVALFVNDDAHAKNLFSSIRPVS